MKKPLLLSTLLTALSFSCYAQWTAGTNANNIVNTNSGNVVVGTVTSPFQKLTVSSQGGGSTYGQSSTDYDFGLSDNNANNPMQLLQQVNSSNLFGHIQALQYGVGVKNLILQGWGGNLGIGSFSPTSAVSIANTNVKSLSLFRNIGTNSTVMINTGVGMLGFGAYIPASGTNPTGGEYYGGYISGVATEGWTTGTVQGTALTFKTTLNTTASVIERMRLDHNGYLGLGLYFASQNNLANLNGLSPANVIEALSSSTMVGIRSLNSTLPGIFSGGGLLAATPYIPSAAGQRLGLVGMGGAYAGTGYRYGATITGYTSEPWSSTNCGSYMVFSTIPNGTGTATEKMRIDNAGNVSIGTTDSKGYLLAIAGTAIATSITVKTFGNWPDFVFKENYQLPELKAIKSYINRYHHLPEVPSADEINKNGLDLGMINNVLIKKVEELTLYMIEKDKQIKDQQVQIDALKNDQQKQINDLKLAMEKLASKI